VADRQVDRRLRGGPGRLSAPDVAVVGGGIVGCSAAAFLAEAGAAVELFERGTLAGAASGRNSGSVQHPFDPELVALHEQTLAIYREMGVLAGPPVGILTLAGGREPLEPLITELGREFPELRPELIEGKELRGLEPALAPGLFACRLETGYPLGPTAATLGLAERARRAGAVLNEGATASVLVEDSRAVGVDVDGQARAAGAVLVAAGPWTPALADPTGAWRPIKPLWGVIAEVAIDRPPRHVLEEAGVEAVAEGSPGSIFSLVTAEGVSALGSTFTTQEPAAGDTAPSLLKAAAGFVPALDTARLVSSRACARPQSADGRPLLGELPGLAGLHVAAGHGPWGISLGPASGALAAAALLGSGEVPPPLAAARFPLG
jgi:D-hydroxyproline dehydrogenase subunit beta